MRLNVPTRLRQALSQPPHQTAAATLRWARRRAEAEVAKIRHKRTPTFLGPPAGRLARLLPRPDPDLLGIQADALAGVTANYLMHRFDLLGSGWVRVRHGMRARGLEQNRYDSGAPVVADASGTWLRDRVNAANLATAKRIWRLVDPDYQPIDWHVDFISGFRWSGSTWYLDVAYARDRGADVKVPWELSRGQHLPQLALARALAATGDERFETPGAYETEFRNQVLDFMATNPPRYGVNWRCTMEVGIRVANWLVAYDLFQTQKVKFDPAFETRFLASVNDHAEFIVANLEWGPGLRSNHYLADVAGLLFAAAYLPSGPRTDALLAFAISELVTEVGLQFGEDGANFEGSTCYHRLSAEMVAYATALTLGLPESRVKRLEGVDPRSLDVPPPFETPPQFAAGDPFPGWYRDRLGAMADFTVAATKPDGRVAQIGDNDSGRFLKLLPSLTVELVADASKRLANLGGYHELPEDASHWIEDHLDHRHLVAALNGVVRRADLADFAGPAWAFETDLVVRLTGASGFDAAMGPLVAEDRRAGGRTSLSPGPNGPDPDGLTAAGTHRQVRWRLMAPGEQPLTDGLVTRSFDAFGLYVFRSSRLFLAVRCGPVGQQGNGGHAHNDQLGIELSIDGRIWFADPGTYVYTPLPEQRNRYRSAAAHWVPRVGEEEPGPLDLGLFTSPERANARCLAFSPSTFWGAHDGYGEVTVRQITLGGFDIEIVDTIPRRPGDTAADQTNRVVSNPAELASLLCAPPFSPGYGVVLAR